MKYKSAPAVVIVVVVGGVLLLEDVVGGSLSWVTWPYEYSNSSLGYSTDSCYRSMTEYTCQIENGTLLNTDNPDILKNYNELKSFFSKYLDYNQDYWISNTSTYACPCTKYLNDTIVTNDVTDCDNRMLRVICIRLSIPGDVQSSLVSTTAKATEDTTTASTATMSTITGTSVTTARTMATSTTTTSSTPMTTTTTSNTIHSSTTGNILSTTVRHPDTDNDPSLFTTTLATDSTVIINHPSFVLSWNEWLRWTECSARCGGGERLRIKICDEESCPRPLGSILSANISYDIQVDVCNDHVCPVWSEWSAWIGCNGSCDQAVRMRSRICHGGNVGDGCSGSDKHVEFCQFTDDEQTSCDAEDKSRQKDLSSEGPPYKQADGRPSAIGTGVVALIFVVIEISLLLVVDFTSCRRHFRLCRRNISNSKIYPRDR